ncbi:delta-sarcoglycan-like [Colias croceus]|uniref:delta-sarcoglycan-like n=1 Tax=Colias crocea TaxID=72248 RepID=UPI001E27CC42|nr:delta-sarcoglycan-like [Colias croceus]XP_045492516.1 delta-sarcoglycan-like [Colias croceus]XP_045492517.1 delta-sarcoglycan-like [Colias croceus]XP_045492518.1 delta-sarcoglycan-like [Colias croceus]
MKVEDATTEGIRGWECTPTEGQPDVAVSSEKPTKPKCIPVVLREGWRRTSLYAIIIFLMVLIFLNIALTLWVISTLRLTKNGIGPITITKDGIKLDGKVWMIDELIASAITTQTAQHITLHSHRNFTVLVSEPDRKEQAKFVIKRDAVECTGRVFEVHDALGGNIFHASKEEVRVFAETLAVDGPGGVSVKSALQTPVLRAPPGFDLHLESLTRRLDLRAPQSIYLESRAGGIEITSHSNIKLESAVGAIKMDAPNIIINNLKEATYAENPQKNARSKKVYQLCACASGKLFLAPPDALCSQRETDTELCR